MTADQYADDYLNVEWDFEGVRLHASVRKYLAMDSSICDASRIRGAKAAHKMLLEAADKSESVEKQGGAFLAKTKDGNILVPANSLESAFRGKGTPSDLKQILQLATVLGQIVADPAKASKGHALPQDYADWYLGMDCSGFAFNFLGLHGKIVDLDEGHANERRKSLTDIKAGDVKISDEPGKRYHHIAIVTEVTPVNGKIKIKTAESSGADATEGGSHFRQGVSHHWYYIGLKSPGVFGEVRGSGVRPGDLYFQPVPQRTSPRL